MQTRKIIAGSAALIMAASVFTGCGNATTDSPASGTTVAISVTTNAEDQSSETSDTAQITDTEAVTGESVPPVSEGNEVTEPVSTEDYGDKSDAEIVYDKVNSFVQRKEPADVTTLYEICDLDVVYYIAEGKKANSKDEVIKYFSAEENKAEIEGMDFTNEDYTYTIEAVQDLELAEGTTAVQFLAIEDEQGLNKFLATMFGVDEGAFESTSENETPSEEAAEDTMEGFVPFSQAKKEFDIEDVRIVTVHATAPEGDEYATDMDIFYYVFKINGVWKIDLVYTMEHTMFSMFAGLGEMFGEETETEAEELQDVETSGDQTDDTTVVETDDSTSSTVEE